MQASRLHASALGSTSWLNVNPVPSLSSTLRLDRILPNVRRGFC